MQELAIFSGVFTLIFGLYFYGIRVGYKRANGQIREIVEKRVKEVMNHSTLNQVCADIDSVILSLNKIKDWVEAGNDTKDDFLKIIDGYISDYQQQKAVYETEKIINELK